MAGLYIRMELRPCYVTVYTNDPKKTYKIIKNGEKKGLFHCWEHKSEVIPPSPMMGGHNGGPISGTLGIVEFEDGTVHEVNPGDIRFIDDMHKQYTFEGEENDGTNKTV